MMYSVMAIFGWIKAGQLMDEVRQLSNKAENVNLKIQEINRNINLHYFYSSVLNRLENEVQDLQALTDQRAYWRMVSSSYQEIKGKVIHWISPTINNFKSQLIKPTCT
jgi:hypothetical protein